MPDHASNIDVLWLLICAALVMLMQGGFTCLETGRVRAKNSINVAIKNLVDFCTSSLAFWVAGFAFMHGPTAAGLIGTQGFLFDAHEQGWWWAFFFFQMVFCGTATTLVSGAVAERMRFTGYLVTSLMVSLLIYPILGHWMWGGLATGQNTGWLNQLGFIDFAGSTVVHSTGGWVALAAILVIGSRHGRFSDKGAPIQGQNLPLATLGVLLLWFGWYGFNGGSSLEFTQQASQILVNTTLAGATGALTALGLSWYHLKRPDVGHALNGVLAGLVSITASANIMSPEGTILIAVGAGIICVGTTIILERLHIDDAIGVVPVHACVGVWGTIVFPFLSTPDSWGTGLTVWEQVGIQFLGSTVCFFWAFGIGFAILRLINQWVPLRVTAEEERIGLNMAEHAAGTAILDLLAQMEEQRNSHDFTRHVLSEPHTEVYQIAEEYNRVLDTINTERQRRQEMDAALAYGARLDALFQEIAKTTNESSTIEDAMQLTMDLICRNTGWPVGHLYLLSENTSHILIPTTIWHLEYPERFETFRSITEQTDFQAGEGLPGRVLASGKPCWIRDVTQDPIFLRPQQAKDIGVKAGFGFPIIIGEQVVGVLEFFSTETMEPDAKLLQVMGYVGAQLGRVVERKRGEAILIHAKAEAEAATKTKADFLATMSHEIRTPLNGIIGMSDILLGTHLSEDQQNCLLTIKDSGDALLTIINDILDFSKIEAGKLTLETIDFDIRETVDAVVDLLGLKAQEKGIELISLINPEIPTTVQGDPVRLRQILMNLIGNAIKFTAQGEIVIQVVPEGDISGTVLLRFMITDTGIGITPEGQGRLFQAFSQEDSSTTRKYGGTGLGLSISKMLAELMGGTIGVHSDLGQGSCFWFTIRLGTQQSHQLLNKTLPCELEDVRIGLIDDNATTRMLLQKYTSYWGMQSIQAENGEKALAAFRKGASNGERCHLALIDMNMPGMDGLQLAKAIKTDPQLASMRLILLNPLVNRVENIHGLNQRHFAAFVNKPVRYKQLHQCLLNVMRRSDVAPSPGTIQRPANEMHKGSGQRLLLVDDNLVNQQVGARMLTTLGYQVDIAANGREAVEAVTRTAYAGVLMDCQMPEMDGFEATREIRKRERTTPQLPIIAMTATAMVGDREKCLETGMNDFLSKPVKLEDLRCVLEKWLFQASSTRNHEGATESHQPDKQEASLRSGTSAPNPSPPLDSATLADLRRLGGDEDPAFFISVIEQFCQDSVTHMNGIKLAIQENKSDSLKKMAHAFKGCSRTIGARPLAEIAFQLEQMGQTQNLEKAQAIFMTLQSEFERVQTALQDELKQSAATLP
ncbi:MAG: ammonium transporter [Nitrospiraceae bacterium]|nr:ammonium transporter [Nitrospira sp.]MCB9773829.1 ammonium transporter [Nitrospiraceae bacterium]